MTALDLSALRRYEAVQSDNSDATTPHRCLISDADGWSSKAWTWQALLSPLHARDAESAAAAVSKARNIISRLRALALDTGAPRLSHLEAMMSSSA